MSGSKDLSRLTILVPRITSHRVRSLALALGDMIDRRSADRPNIASPWVEVHGGCKLVVTFDRRYVTAKAIINMATQWARSAKVISEPEVNLVELPVAA